MASGDASLAGAEFTFRYYDGQYATAAETEASGAPTRTWAFKTNEKGRIRIMDESLKVSGDDLFYNSMGQITLPIGTLLIQETKAPEGYLIDPTVYVRNITPDGTLEAVNSYNAPTVSEQVVTGRIQIVKHTDTGTTKVETPEVGATFNIYLASAGSYDAAPANARAQLTIDKDGFAVSPDLPYGLYTVEQTSGWEGSRLMEPFTVKIDENGKTYSYIINNERFYSYLKVVKVDAITGEAIPAAGIGFQIIDPQGQKLEWWGADTWYTDGSGVMKLPCELEYGRGYASYARHISKLQAFFRCINPSMSDQLLQELANYLREFYAGFDLVPADGSSVTGRAATDYPTLSQFREFLQGYITFVAQQDKAAETEVETAIHVEQARNLQILLGAVENLCSNYGRLFDGHTTISDITGEKIVTFDISTIKELGNVFTAQMQNLVSLCWDNAIAVGGPEKEKWESGAYAIEDITKFLILIDESHRWVNTSMPLILDMVTRYLREARKYFAGIVLASQSVRDYMPEGDFSGADNIRILFELCQYKFMFKQDSSAKEHIRRIFGEGMTFSQVESIPFLEQGENVLSIAGAGALQFRVWLSRDYEATLFSGGR